jgi:hypothetical protein
VDVTLDSGIEFVDGAFVELGSVFLYPTFELAIGGLALFDVIDQGITIEADTVDDHLVVALARAGITGGEFARGFEREFEPQAWKMQNAKRTGNAGADKWNNRIHNFFVLIGFTEKN